MSDRQRNIYYRNVYHCYQFVLASIYINIYFVLASIYSSMFWDFSSKYRYTGITGIFFPVYRYRNFLIPNIPSCVRSVHRLHDQLLAHIFLRPRPELMPLEWDTTFYGAITDSKIWYCTWILLRISNFKLWCIASSLSHAGNSMVFTCSLRKLNK